jgi:signal transduction histidine kinase
MKVASRSLGPETRAALESWGWRLDADPAFADAILSESAGRLEIRTASTSHADDVVFPPFEEHEVRFRIEQARKRRERLAGRIHDLRSSLNAIQGYAEMLAETEQGEALRFASNICTASDVLTKRIAGLREEGV